ncbi:MAG: ATP synthase F1 subunit epsilon [Planctomycetota bacterium]
MASINCDIITPERAVFSGTCESLTLPVFDGMIGVLPGHAPFVSELGIGLVTLTRHDETGLRTTERFAVRDGFVQVVENKVSVLAVQAVASADVTKVQPADEGATADDRRWNDARRQLTQG